MKGGCCWCCAPGHAPGHAPVPVRPEMTRTRAEEGSRSHAPVPVGPEMTRTRAEEEDRRRAEEEARSHAPVPVAEEEDRRRAEEEARSHAPVPVDPEMTRRRAKKEDRRRAEEEPRRSEQRRKAEEPRRGTVAGIPVVDTTHSRGENVPPITVRDDPTVGDITPAPVIEENANLDELIKYIEQLLQRITDKKGSSRQKADWPTSSGFRKLKEFLSEGINVVKDVITDTSTVIRGFLQGMGTAHLVTACLLVVADILERFETVSQNRDECLVLLNEMFRLARNVKDLKERAMSVDDKEGIVKESTELIVEGSLMCCVQIDSSKFWRFFKSNLDKEQLDKFKDKLGNMFRHIQTKLSILHIHKKPVLSRPYPKDAVAIEDRMNEILGLLQWENQNALAIILVGPEGIGKSVLADAVFSRVERTGLKYSKVELFDKINSTKRDVLELQRQILKDLNGEEETPEIRKHEDGQEAIGGLLRKVEAIIYIDHVLEADGLRYLLPKDLKNAKKLRLLLTVRDIKVCNVCKVGRVPYHVRELAPEAAMLLLKREMSCEGQINPRELITDDQLRDIANRCNHNPLLLIGAAETIHWEEDNQTAYSMAMEFIEEKKRGMQPAQH